MNARAAELVAGGTERMPRAGGQIYVDLDLSVRSLPPRQLARGWPGCAPSQRRPVSGLREIRGRFGAEAMRFVDSRLGRQLRLRGMNTRVVQPGLPHPVTASHEAGPRPALDNPSGKFAGTTATRRPYRGTVAAAGRSGNVSEPGLGHKGHERPRLLTAVEHVVAHLISRSRRTRTCGLAASTASGTRSRAARCSPGPAAGLTLATSRQAFTP